jgi:hypothetical protein
MTIIFVQTLNDNEPSLISRLSSQFDICITNFLENTTQIVLNFKKKDKVKNCLLKYNFSFHGKRRRLTMSLCLKYNTLALLNVTPVCIAS